MGTPFKILIFGSGMAFYMLFGSSIAEAGWYRNHAFGNCVASWDVNGNKNVVADSTTRTLVNNDPYYAGLVVCSIPDRSDIPAESFTGLDVYVSSPSGYAITARACVKYWHAAGGTCGPWVSGVNNVKGTYSLHVDTSTWVPNSQHFKFIEVSLPQSGTEVIPSTQASKLYGYAVYY